jgi:hypothetical protein
MLAQTAICGELQYPADLFEDDEDLGVDRANRCRSDDASACDDLLALLMKEHPEYTPAGFVLKSPDPAPTVSDTAQAPPLSTVMNPPDGERGPPNFRHHPVTTICRVTAAHFKLDMSDMLSRRRQRNVVRARQVIMLVCKQLTSLSLPEIARRMGGRDHTTIIHGVQVMRALVEYDPIWAAHVQAVRELAIAADPALGAMA